MLFSAPVLSATGPPPTNHFHIEAQPLGQALSAWRQQSGLDFGLALTASVPQSSAVEGDFTPEEALRALLKGTDLIFSIEEGRALIRYEKKKARPPPPTPTPRPTPATNKPIATDVPGVIVTGTKIAGSRTGSPVRRLTASDISHFGPPSIDWTLQRLPELTPGGVSGDSPDARLSLGLRLPPPPIFVRSARRRH